MQALVAAARGGDEVVRARQQGRRRFRRRLFQADEQRLSRHAFTLRALPRMPARQDSRACLRVSRELAATRRRRSRIDVVAVSAVRINHVLAEDALLHGSKPQDRGARFLVIDVRLEFDSPALQHVERVPQLQQLGFGINVGALERGSDPGYADFKTPVLPLDVVMARRTNGFIRRQIDCRKRQCGPRSTRGQGLLDEGRHGTGTIVRAWQPAPDRFLGAGGGQIVEMPQRQRLERNTRSFDQNGVGGNPSFHKANRSQGSELAS